MIEALPRAAWRSALGLIGLSALLIVTEGAQAEPAVRYDLRSKRVSRDAAEAALTALRRACPLLDRNWSDVREVRVETGDEYVPHRLANGWTVNLHVAVALKDDLSGLPEADEGIGVVAGHTLHYDLGGGAKPGMLGSKRVSQWACGMPISATGADSFKTVPELSLLRY